MTLNSSPNEWVTLFAEETEEGISNSGKSMLSVTTTHNVPDAWMEILRGIVEEKWPAGFQLNVPNSFLFDAYPEDMQKFCTQHQQELGRRVNDVFGLIRWRFHDDIDEGTHLSGGAFEWSETGEVWHRLRFRPELSVRLTPHITLNPVVGETLEALSKGMQKQPLGREIWHAALTADPRTSVILAVTAVEVELKRIVSASVPKSDWLVTNLPSPPIVRILVEYLPTIVDIPPGLKVPESLVSSLRKAVRLRNDFVHGGAESATGWMAPEMLGERTAAILETTSDLLWLFDAYRGHLWALSFLSDSTRAAMKLFSD